MLLDIPDMDAVSDSEINNRINNHIHALLNSSIGSGQVAVWMTPHCEGSFNQTKYELQAIVKHAHDLLMEWSDAGSVHGLELSPVATSFFQLLVNITSCSSGKAAGVHTAFVETPGLHNIINEDVLIEPVSPKLKAFLASREEADIQIRPKVLAFIRDANEVYYNFRMDLLNASGPFLQALIGKNSQPSHQRDYAYHVLGEALGLSFKGEVVSVDLCGQLVHAALESMSPEALLQAYWGTAFEGGRNFIEALIDQFYLHWSTKIEAGLNKRNASNEERQAYHDFEKTLSAAGMNTNTLLDTIEDDEGNYTFIFKKSAVAEILCALGILNRV